MTSEKYASLLVYRETLEHKLKSAEVPKKHQDAPEAYRDWLRLEIRRTSLRLENDAVVEPKAAK